MLRDHIPNAVVTPSGAFLRGAPIKDTPFAARRALTHCRTLSKLLGSYSPRGAYCFFDTVSPADRSATTDAIEVVASWFGGLGGFGFGATRKRSVVSSTTRNVVDWDTTPNRKRMIGNPFNPSNPPLTLLPPYEIVPLQVSRKVLPRELELAHRLASQSRSFRSFRRSGASIGASAGNPLGLPSDLQHPPRCAVSFGT